jgi:hypothetical protein
MAMTSETQRTLKAEFKEFEVKYLLDDSFDTQYFFQTLLAMGTPVEKHLDVTDTYYRFADRPDYICRHRHDLEIQQLTVKSYGGDTRERVEVNLSLTNQESQAEAIATFLSTFGRPEVFGIRKRVDIFDFPDCEVVHYVAESAGRRVRCVEFEAVGVETWAQAAAVIDRYAGATGFAGLERCEIALFDLLSGGDSGS